MNCSDRVAKIMELLDLFDATFPNHLCKSAYLMGILIDLSCKSEEYYEDIDEQVRGLILWKTMTNQEEHPEDQEEILL
jgi:hypothetical protein